MLREEVNNPQSTLVQAGEDRVRMVNEMVARIQETLKKLEKVAKRYQVLDSGSKTKQLWSKFKWSVEFSNVEALRSKTCLLSPTHNL